RNSFSGLFSGLLLGLWLVAIAGLAVSAADLGPKINNYLATSQEQVQISRTYDHKDFSKLYIGGTIQATVKPGKDFSITAVGRQQDLDRLSFDLVDGQLQITQVSRQTKGKICFFCWDKTVNLQITLPELVSYVGINRSQADISGFNKDLYVSLGEVSQSQLALVGQNLNCSLSGINSQLHLTGQAKAVDCRLNGQARLQTADFKADSIKLKQSVLSKVYLVGQGGYLESELSDLSRLQALTWPSDQIKLMVQDNGRAEVYALEKLTAEVQDNGRVFYKGQPVDLIKQENDNGRVQKKGADGDSEDYSFYWQPVDENLIIKFDSRIYSPIMSSIRGIALRPDYQVDYPVEYEWYTDKGSLVEDWSKPVYINKIINQGQPVYWTFGPSDKLDNQDGPITVYLKAKDITSGQTKDTTALELDWLDQITVQVKD
ncbi:MAG: GIN domain-containing protein, partial [Patescibacteria group bacterium]